jgi:hypothetical protein
MSHGAVGATAPWNCWLLNMSQICSQWLPGYQTVRTSIEYRSVHFFLNPILFAIRTSTFSKFCINVYIDM